MDELNAILEGCRKNDRGSQAKLFRHLAPKLLGVCRRYIRQHDEAEDAMQESFVKIFASLGTLRETGSLEAWARRIAANTALSALRKSNRIVFERNLDVVETIAFTEEETAQISTDEILACLDDLPAGYRVIINLFLVEGFSHREIAEKLNLQESTSRSQYSRARQSLLRLLKQKSPALNIRNAYNG